MIIEKNTIKEAVEVAELRSHTGRATNSIFGNISKGTYYVSDDMAQDDIDMSTIADEYEIQHIVTFSKGEELSNCFKPIF